VRKHARAQAVEIDLREERSAVVCTLRDDGVGFDAGGIGRATGRRGMRLHLGLDATIERVRVAGGTFTIESAPVGGTSVRFTIPIHRQGDIRAS
jgi:signal transduction histidine kinase